MWNGAMQPPEYHTTHSFCPSCSPAFTSWGHFYTGWKGRRLHVGPALSLASHMKSCSKAGAQFIFWLNEWNRWHQSLPSHVFSSLQRSSTHCESWKLLISCMADFMKSRHRTYISCLGLGYFDYFSGDNYRKHHCLRLKRENKISQFTLSREEKQERTLHLWTRGFLGLDCFIWIPALPLFHCETLGRLANLSQSPFMPL